MLDLYSLECVSLLAMEDFVDGLRAATSQPNRVHVNVIYHVVVVLGRENDGDWGGLEKRLGKRV